MSKVFYVCMTALAGFVIGANVAILRPNPSYEASWQTVCIELAFLAFFAAMAISRNTKGR